MDASAGEATGGAGAYVQRRSGASLERVLRQGPRRVRYAPALDRQAAALRPVAAQTGYHGRKVRLVPPAVLPVKGQGEDTHEVLTPSCQGEDPPRRVIPKTKRKS